MARDVLAGDRTCFVDSSEGDDGASGTEVAPLKTVQAAWNLIAAQWDLAGHVAKIKLAPGTYPSPVGIGNLRDLGKPIIGGTVIIEGDALSPQNVVLASSGGDCIEVCTSYVEVDGIKLLNSGGSGLHTYRQGVIFGRNLDFGAASQAHCFCDNQGQIVLASYRVSGGASVHWLAHSGGYINCDGRTVTLTGTPGFSIAFARAQLGGLIECIGNSYAGSATGPRFLIQGGGVIDPQTQNLAALPGNQPGVIEEGVYGVLGLVNIYTPTISSTAGAIGSATVLQARYSRYGNMVDCRVRFTLANNGTGSGGLCISLPTPMHGSLECVAHGMELNGALTMTGVAANTNAVAFYRFDGVYPGITGRTYAVQIRYEAA